MIIYVLDDGETWTINDPTPIAVTDDQLSRLQDGEKLYHVIPNWHEQPNYPCSCRSCTSDRKANYLIVKAQQEAACME